jgi:mannosyltransferase OCH1-like enzyme
MIPKIVFQYTNEPTRQYSIDMIQELSPNWEYKNYNEEEVLRFLEENPCVSFPEITEKYKTMPKEMYKKELFKYYFLYVKGGFYIDIHAMIEQNIDSIVKEYGFVSVLSYLDSSIFQGVIGCSPKNPIIMGILSYMYDKKEDELNTNDLMLSKELYKIIHEKTYDFEVKLYKEIKKESKYIISAFNEDTNEKICTHYFINKMIPRPYKKPESIEKTKIGITFILTNKLVDIFTNGIKQNAIFLYDLFYNIGYDVFLIVPDDSFEYTKTLCFWNKPYIKYMKLSDMILNDFHIVIQFCFQLEEHIFDFLSISGVKTIFYNCGNKFFIESEACLYGNKQVTGFQYNNFHGYYFHEIWLIPQMVNTCLHYMKTLYRCNVKEVPFVWSPSIIEEYEKDLGKSIKYRNRGEQKKISIFEPNLSIMKWCFPSILICENVERSITDKSKIKHVYVTNINGESNKVFDIPLFNSIVKSLDLVKNKKVSVEARYNSLYFMSEHSDIAVSHQMENPLNYLYFDLAWMGWPIVHNASLCKDVGYYYEGFNYDEGAEVLKNAILTHDENVEEYTKRNRTILNKYLPTNKYLQEQYISLVNSVL